MNDVVEREQYKIQINAWGHKVIVALCLLMIGADRLKLENEVEGREEKAYVVVIGVCHDLPPHSQLSRRVVENQYAMLSRD